MANLNIFRSAYQTAQKIISGGLWTRLGGQGWSKIRLLAPGSRFDFEREAGDLWSNAVVGLCLDWLGNRYPRPLLRVSKIKADGDFKPLPRHGLVDLWSKPNPHYNRRTMEKAVGLSLKCDGNAYIYKVRDRGGRVVQLWWIPHYRILPTWPSDGSEYIDGYRVWLDSVVYHLPPEDVLHIRDGIDPRNERLGMSALRACIREVCTINEESSYSAAILRNSGVPGLVLVPATEKLNVKQEDADQMRDQIRETAGGDNRGQSIILKGMYNIEMIGFSPEQLALKEMPVVPTARVLGSLGVASMSLGLPDSNKTYSNIQEANRTSWGGIVATQELIAESMRWDLLPEFGDDPYNMMVEYDYTHIEEMQESLDAKWTRTITGWEKGVVRLDEAREALGLEPGDIPEEDLERWFPGTGSPEEIERQEEQQQAQLESAAASRQAALTQNGNGNGNGNENPGQNGNGKLAPGGNGKPDQNGEGKNRLFLLRGQEFVPIAKEWVTLEGGQHVYIGPEGGVQPHGPGSKPVAEKPSAGHSDDHQSPKPSAPVKPSSEPKPQSTHLESPSSKPAETMPATSHKEFTKPGQKVSPEAEHGMQSWQKEHFGGWHNSLSPSEKAGIDKYAGNAHEGMNGMLRNPKLAQSYEALHPGSTKAVEGASKALNKASMPETVAAYRGVRDAAAVFGGNLKEGATSHDAGFMSLSQDHRVASQFLKGGEASGALIRVTVPKGSKVAGVSMNEKSVKTSEHELLAAPGHGLRITKITKKGGKTYIDAELVPPKTAARRAA